MAEAPGGEVEEQGIVHTSATATTAASTATTGVCLGGGQGERKGPPEEIGGDGIPAHPDGQADGGQAAEEQQGVEGKVRGPVPV